MRLAQAFGRRTGQRHLTQRNPSQRGRRLLRLLSIALVISVSGAVAWAYWSAPSSTGGNGAVAATAVNGGATPTATVTGPATVALSWAATTLTSGQAVSGYQIRRYDASTQVLQTILTACAGTVAALTCTESNVPTGSWKYTVTPVIGANWAGVESAKSAAVTTDQTAPVNNLTLSNVSGSAYKNANTVYYQGSAAGSFTLTNAVTDVGTGPASSQTAALGGTSTGWTHTPSTVSSPASGPYVSNPFSWATATTSAPTEAVTGRDAGANAATTSLTFTNDTTNPGGGTLSYANGYSSTRSVTLTFTPGTDSGSGINPSLGRLKRSVAPLVNGVCGTYVTDNNYAIVPTSPYVDSNVVTGKCYVYQYTVTDNVGNKVFYSSSAGSVAKIDYAGAISSTAGLLSQWRLGESATGVLSADSFTAGANAALLSARTGETAATWTAQAANSTTAETASWAAVASRGQAIRRSSAVGTALYYTSATPASADYRVGADVEIKSLLAGEVVGVVGRLDTAGTGAGTYYQAGYDVSAAQWQLYPVINGVVGTAVGAAYAQTLTVGQIYHLDLDLSGTTISLRVDGAVRITGTDAQITSPGRGGVRFSNTTNAGSSTTGLSLDNFQMLPGNYPRAVDSVGSNTGDYYNGPTLGVAGAIANSSDTAVQFDGVSDYMRVPAPTGLPVGASTRSVELWFKTTGTLRQALYTYGSGTPTGAEFGLWLEAGGAKMKAWGVGGADLDFTLASALNNGQWHQVVVTYNGTAVTLYVDGASVGTQNSTRSTIIDQYGFSLGGVLVPLGTSPGYWFAGSMDEVSFYSTVLSPSVVTGHYQLGTSSVADFTGPTGGSVDATGLVGTGSRYSTSTTLNLAFAKGTDPSGVAPAGNQLQRATATLAAGACGSYGSYVQVGANDPVSPTTDTVADGACYRYRYVVLDTQGNSTTNTSPDIKVDTVAPAAASFAFSGFANTSATGNTVYYRPGATTGGFTVTASATDARAGIASYSFPSFGAGWTSTPGTLGVNSYSWAAPSPAAPGSPSVTATNNAGTPSTGSPITMIADSTAPSAGTITYADGSTTGTTVSVAFTTGSDSGSGLGTPLLQRAVAPAAGATCGAYGSFTTVANGTNPTSPVVDAIAAGNCYRYQYVVADNVGNQSVATSPNVAHTAFGAYWAFDAGSGTTAVDSTGNGNTATLQAGAGWTTGRIGPSGLNLNGTSTSWASAPNPVVDTSQSYTVTAWVNENSLTGTHTFVSVDGSNVSPFYLQRGSDGRFAFTNDASDSTTATEQSVYGTTPTVGTWYQLVGVYDRAAGTIQLYVNGVSQGTATVTAGWKATGSTNVGRGLRGGAAVDFTDGVIDEVHVYDRALTSAEVAALP